MTTAKSPAPRGALRESRNSRLYALAGLYALDSASRGLSLTIIPLQAHQVFGDDAKVSAVYFTVTFAGFLAAFAIPGLIHRFRRRWVYSAGLLTGGLALACLIPENAAGQVAGQMLRALSGSATMIGLTLYVLDSVERSRMTTYESLRLLLGCLSWGLGPWIGVELYKRFGIVAPAALALTTSLAAMAFFWRLRIGENPVLVAATGRPPSPIASILRFIAQPRLRLAWFIAFARSGWWSMIFVYPALYFSARDVDPGWSGALIGATNILLTLSPVFGWLGRRYGIRRPIMIGFLGCGLATAAIPLVFAHPPLVAALVLLAAVFAVILDSLGNVPFLRSVRPLERPQMASVFRTYVDLGSVLPFAVFTCLLVFFDQRAVYVFYGAFLCAAAGLAAYLPRRM